MRPAWHHSGKTGADGAFLFVCSHGTAPPIWKRRPMGCLRACQQRKGEFEHYPYAGLLRIFLRTIRTSLSNQPVSLLQRVLDVCISCNRSFLAPRFDFFGHGYTHLAGSASVQSQKLDRFIGPRTDYHLQTLINLTSIAATLVFGFKRERVNRLRLNADLCSAPNRLMRQPFFYFHHKRCSS